MYVLKQEYQWEVAFLWPYFYLIVFGILSKYDSVVNQTVNVGTSDAFT